MIDASNDKHFPARVQMDRNKILATCAVHKTLSESGNEFELQGEWYQGRYLVETVKKIKGCADPSHFIFENQCRKESDPTYNDSENE